MKNEFLVGEKIYLRGLDKTDLEGDYFRWLNDPEVTRFMETGLFPNTPEKMESFYNSINSNNNNIMFAIIDRKTEKHIGNIKLGPINWVHRNAVFGTLIGNREYWGKGCATEAVKLILSYAFERLNLNKVEAGVVECNIASIKKNEKCGMRIEGRRREIFCYDGKFYDGVLMGITRQDYYGQKNKKK